MKYFLPDLYVGRILDLKMMFVILVMVLFSMTLMIMLALVLLVSVGSNQLVKMLMVVDIFKLNNTVNLINIILAGAVGEYWL